MSTFHSKLVKLMLKINSNPINTVHMTRTISNFSTIISIDKYLALAKLLKSHYL